MLKLFTALDVIRKARNSGLRGELNQSQCAQFMQAFCQGLRNEDTMDMANGLVRIAELQTGFDMVSGNPADVVKRYQQQAVYDNGYLALFEPVNLTGTTDESWEIYSETPGITWQKLEKGGEIRLHRQGAGKQTYSVDYFAAGMEVLLHWIQNQKWYKIERAKQDFERSYYRFKAEFFYGLLDAISSSINVAWVAGATTLARDIATINAACAEIVEALSSYDIAMNEGEAFVLTAPNNVTMKTRILKALLHMMLNPNAQQSAVTNSTDLVIYNVVPVFTSHLDASDVYYISAPKRNTQMATKQEPVEETEKDILRQTQVTVRTAAFGGAIATIDQHRRCAIA